MKFGIAGAGKIGISIARLLSECDFCTGILLADIRSDAVEDLPVKTEWEAADFSALDEVERFAGRCDAVLSAAPYYHNRTIAQACTNRGVAYFDLTEDVATTAFVRALAEESGVTMMPQCGLAPGAINIIGAGLAHKFSTVRTIELRVGALPLCASNRMKYYLSWSTAGLINEYCELCDVLYEGKPLKTIPLEDLEHLTIDGVEYEAFNTSGGVATMCESFAGLARDLNYKTIRYPGHRDLIRFLIKDLNLGRRRDLLAEIFDQEVPMSDQDVVIGYVNVVGLDARGRLQQRNWVKKIRGATVGGANLSAIQLSTAAGAVAALELLCRGRLAKGFVAQDSVSLADFFSTHWGGRVYGS